MSHKLTLNKLERYGIGIITHFNLFHPVINKYYLC